MHKASKVIFENERGHPIRIAYPAPALRAVIEYYFELDLLHSPSIKSIKGLPALNTLLAFQLRASDWTSINDANGCVQQLKGSQFLGHLTHSYSSIYASGTQIFFIKLKPGSAVRLFRCSPTDLENNQLPLSFLFNYPNFEEQLITAGSFITRVQYCNQVLLKKTIQLPDPGYKFKVVEHSIRKFESLQLKGEKGLEHLCHTLHVTYASMRRYFLATLGVTPKFTQRTIRFKKALQAYRQHGYKFYYEDFGYTDFSHFAKEARAFTGKSPLEL
jgi:AraC-like DNA-binding protein